VGVLLLPAAGARLWRCLLVLELRQLQGMLLLLLLLLQLQRQQRVPALARAE
jgi:hypothetical protein